MKVYQVLMSLSEVPLYSVVSKRSGSLLYRVFDYITIFGAEECASRRQTISAHEGCRFLQSENQKDRGCFNEYPGTMMVLVHLTVEQLRQLEYRNEPTEL